MTGIADLQADFEVDNQQANFRSRKTSGKQRARSKQVLADKKKRVNKAFRGKIPDGLTGSERAAFVARKARKIRVAKGIEGVPRKARRRTGTSTINLRATVRRFVRTGKLPRVEVGLIRESDAHGVDSESLRQMIQAMLNRGGIEENPGPKSKKEAAKWVLRPKVEGSVVAPVVAAPAVVVAPIPVAKPEQPKADEVVEEVDDLCEDALERRPKYKEKLRSALSRQREKEEKCAGNQPGDAKRFTAKKNASRKNFSKDSLLKKAEMVDDAKVAGKAVADAELAVDKTEEDEAEIHEVFGTTRKSFVMRSGGFARPWYSGFGNPTSRAKMFLALCAYLPMWYRWITRGGKLPLWNPRVQHEGAQVWLPYCDEDEEKFTPVFKGIVFSVAACLMLTGVVAFFGVFTWICTLGYATSWIAWAISMMAETTASIQIFSMVFRPIQRYQSSDLLVEVSSTKVRAVDPFFRSPMRGAGNRFRPATDAPILADVQVVNVSIHDATKWYGQYWRTSWILGSLFTWIECNRLMKLIHNAEDYVISLRLADNIAYALTRSKLSSYEDVLSKARSIASNYDEMRLGVQPVDNRNVHEDTIRYAAALYWSKAAGDASFLNESSPHSD